MTNVQDQDEHGPVLTVTEARGALRGRHMAWVLGISMVLIVIGFAALLLANGPGLSVGGNQPTVNNQTVAKGFQAPPPQPRKSDNGKLGTPGIGADGRGL
jgi:hypothetical protein